jgi:PKD repeat protein
MKKNILLLSTISFVFLSVISCKKEKPGMMPDPFYSYTTEGFTVQFKNLSRFATSYKWDFGDGTASTEASPVHTYPHKGKYVPTLIAIGENGKEAEASTVLHLSKGSSVNLNDNTLSDWDTVTHNVVIGGKNSGNFIEAKYDYDGNYLYVYFEQITKVSDGNIYDMYIDMDNNPATGFISNDMPGGGYDMLLEGTVFGGWLDVDPFTGGANQASFTFSNINVSSYYKMGAVQQSGDTLRFEYGIVRSKIPGLSSTQGIKIFVQANSNDWSTVVGTSPDIGTKAFFLDMSE